jgi:hypothetical protein
MLERIVETPDIEELRALAIVAFRRLTPEQRLSILDHEADLRDLPEASPAVSRSSS